MLCFDGDPSVRGTSHHNTMRQQAEANSSGATGTSRILLNDFIFDTYDVLNEEEMLVFFPSSRELHWTGGGTALRGGEPEYVKVTNSIAYQQLYNGGDNHLWSSVESEYVNTFFNTDVNNNVGSLDIYGVSMSSHVLRRWFGFGVDDFYEPVMSGSATRRLDIEKNFGGFTTVGNCPSSLIV